MLTGFYSTIWLTTYCFTPGSSYQEEHLKRNR